jgi:hypothetical protein
VSVSASLEAAVTHPPDTLETMHDMLAGLQLPRYGYLCARVCIVRCGIVSLVLVVAVTPMLHV